MLQHEQMSAFATPNEREAARDLYCDKLSYNDCDIEIDDDAKASRFHDDGTGELLGVWVQAWVWVNAENLPENL